MVATSVSRALTRAARAVVDELPATLGQELARREMNLHFEVA
jgi:hypothetical protein